MHWNVQWSGRGLLRVTVTVFESVSMATASCTQKHIYLFLVAFLRSLFLSPIFFISVMSLCTSSFDVNEKMWKFTKFFTLNLITDLSEIKPGLLGLFVGLFIYCLWLYNKFVPYSTRTCLFSIGGFWTRLVTLKQWVSYKLWSFNGGPC